MKKLNPFFAVAVVTALLCSGAPAFAQVVSQWNFNNDDLSNPRNDTAPLAFDQTPAASTDNSVSQSAFATELGMTTDYNFGGGKNPPTTGSVAGADILNSTAEAGDFGSSDSGSNLWRIRGQAQNPGDPTGNGWALQAPRYTQGAAFYTDTTGFSNIHVQFDYETTNQGIHDMQVQYTVDGSTWLNVTAAQITIPNQAPYIDTVNNGSVASNLALPQAQVITDPSNGAGVIAGTVGTMNGGWTDGIQIDLSSILGVSNDPNFGIRMVSTFDPLYNNTTPNPSTGQPYSGATGYDTIYTGFAGGVTSVYNNDSGNWRFDNVTISDGVYATPEPASIVLAAFGLSALGLCGWRRRRASLQRA